MPLHEKKKITESRLDDIYASGDFPLRVNKNKFPETEHDPRHAYQFVHDELMLDGNSRQNLATFCSTWLEQEVHHLMDECIDKNMIDKDEYPQTAEIEGRCVHMLADLWNSPDADNTIGCSTTGSSEAAMLGGMAMKWRWRRRMKEAGKPSDKPNLICGPVQICWHKFAKYWDVELREVPMEQGRLILNAEEVIRRCDENTIGVVATLGVTFTCQYEPAAEIAAALDSLQAKTGLDIPLHIDGASGAFIAPFSSPELEWDFRLKRVCSINASGHKFGLAPLGVGWIVWRNKDALPDDLVFMVNYLGDNIPTFALNFSRPGGQVAAQYYTFIRLGREGYRKIHNACYRTAGYIADQITAMGPFEVIYNGRGGIPAVCWSLKEGAEPGFSLYDFADRLRSRGWQVPAYSMPPYREDLVVQRVLVRHGVSMDLGDMLVKDMHRCLDYFRDNPVNRKLTEQEAGGFRH